jgi:hypothetical protein
MMRLTCAALLLVSIAGAAFSAPPLTAPSATKSALPSEPLVVDLKRFRRQAADAAYVDEREGRPAAQHMGRAFVVDVGLDGPIWRSR